MHLGSLWYNRKFSGLTEKISIRWTNFLKKKAYQYGFAPPGHIIAYKINNLFEKEMYKPFLYNSNLGV